ncbi:hypothetical protein K488DRAFT_91955 [Vararia minispora EC-137]|uniref:Uncharacterized protein n=1 Tax=Vararia minispora EC-137 TaxID=1314806 RepID=A0ACB8Q4Z5_9AGAM|nr:hypothetical protein K488DRAFT_91955 [Vararia minispora EC-137]
MDNGKPITMAMRIVYRGNKASRFPAMPRRVPAQKEYRDIITRDFGILGLSPAKALYTFVGGERGVVEMYWETKNRSQLVTMQRLAIDKLQVEKIPDFHQCDIERIEIYFLPPMPSDEARISQKDSPVSVIDYHNLPSAQTVRSSAGPSSSQVANVNTPSMGVDGARPYSYLPPRPTSPSLGSIRPEDIVEAYRPSTSSGKRKRDDDDDIADTMPRKVRHLEGGLDYAEARERTLREELEKLEDVNDINDLEGRLAATKDKIYEIQAREAETFKRIKALINDDSLRDLPAAIDAIDREFSNLRQRAANALAARRAADQERERYMHSIEEIVNAHQGPFVDPNLVNALMQVGDLADGAMR